MNDIVKALMNECRERRHRLFAKMTPGSIAILSGAAIQYRSEDSEFPFRQNSDFYYLCGFTEPNAVLVLTKDREEKVETILFCNAHNKEEEIWTGPRTGVEGAILNYGVDRAFEIETFDSMLPQLMQDKSSCLYTLGFNRVFDDNVLRSVNIAKAKTRKGGSYPKIWFDLNEYIHEMRLIKSPFEIAMMKKAAHISAKGHIRLMQRVLHQHMEYQLEGDFIHECYQSGAKAQAYPPIVGSGKNACTLHYTQNDKPLTAGDLVLVDAGCEYMGYASDITRTYPISGKFSKEQKAIYEVVLKAQLAAIALVKPKLSWDAIQQKILEIMTEGLIELGILKGNRDQLLKERAYHAFYMHSSGHWLGLDVHDVGSYKVNGEWRLLEPGMVLTIEPGLYISGDNQDIDKKWWNIGIRIEDDILVTEQGYEILSEGIPKTVAELEQCIGQSK